MRVVKDNPCLLRKEHPENKLKLFCFHFAGGTANAFRELADLMPNTIEFNAVQLPGRENRFAEPLVSDIKQLIPPLATALKNSMTGDFAFFGYSMGSLVAFELIRHIRREGWELPLHLTVAAFLLQNCTVNAALLYVLLHCVATAGTVVSRKNQVDEG